jgi:hypothetical protein
MLRRFYIWRAEKRMGRSHYRIDRRHYRGVFKPGFFAHLAHTKFWQTDNDPYLRSRRRRRRAMLVIGLIVLLGMAWVAVESSRALRLF